MVLIQIPGKFSLSDVLGKMADTPSRLFWWGFVSSFGVVFFFISGTIFHL